MTAAGEDLLAGLSGVPPYLIAEDALQRIQAQPSASVDEIKGLAEVAQAYISMARQSRPRVFDRRGWLAKVTSFTFPRTFTRAWGEDGDRYVCFTIEVTDGGKAATGRQVEVQLPVEDAERLGQQMLRIATYQRKQLASATTDSPRATGAGQTPPTDGDQMT